MTWFLGLLASAGYWVGAIWLAAANSGVPCPPLTDCKSAALQHLYDNLLVAAGLYVAIAALFLCLTIFKGRRT